VPRRPDRYSLPSLLPTPLLFLGPSALFALAILFGPDELAAGNHLVSGLLLALPLVLGGWASYQLIWKQQPVHHAAPIGVTPLRTMAVALAGGGAMALLSAQLLQTQGIAAAGLATLAHAVASGCCGMALPATWLTLTEGGASPRERLPHDPWAGQLLLALLATLLTTLAALSWSGEASLASSAWSLPRLLPVLAMAVTAIAAAGTLAPRQSSGWDLRRLAAGEVAVVLLLGVAMALLLNALIGEWEMLTPPVTHPAWLFPVFLINITLFCGAAALHFLRRPGSATLTAMTGLGIGALFYFFFSRYLPGSAASAVGAFFTVIPAGTLDLMTYFSIRTADTAASIRVGLLSAVTATVVALVWLLNTAMGFPLLAGVDLAFGVAVAIPLALGCGLAGATLGRTLYRAAAATAPSAPGWAPWPLLAVLVLIPALLLLLLASETFAPPVA
jgi:hypothetical protein